ncbi:MAG TPA: response regulator transcription factor, partial [Solirubrobacteraceae bacterium]
GDLPGARLAVEEALDRMELCTDDVMRIARVTAVGLGAEADRALRARDLGDRADARDALARARIHMQRLQAAAESGGPVEAAWCTIGAAQLARARGRNDPAPWHRAASAWDDLSLPYPATLARWREVEALVEAGDRDAAAPVARAALGAARGLGARWLVEELASLAHRGRLDMAQAGADPAPEAERDAADPFGLTPREREVLALVAQGATNRQIGAKLFMAEKTASVHVSRILGKLGVQTRTQAAAVAHRQQLA